MIKFAVLSLEMRDVRVGSGSTWITALCRKLAIHVIIDLVDSVTYGIYDVIGWRGSTVSVRMLSTVFNT